MMYVMMHPEATTRFNAPTAASAKEFLRKHKIAEPLPSLFTFAFFSADGTLRGAEAFDNTTTTEKQRADLIEIMRKY